MTERINVTVHSAPLRISVQEQEAVKVSVLSMPVGVRVVGQPGPQGEPGPPGTDAGGWTYLVTRWSSPPTEAGASTVSGAPGLVLAYLLDGITRYRFVPSPYSAALDAFYSTFSGGQLSGLIVSRSD